MDNVLGLDETANNLETRGGPPSTSRRANPYVGPRPFRVGETLYGRSREISELLDLLIAERIVILYSPSGAGKSSLIQAGLIPRLGEEGFSVLPVMRVGAELPPFDGAAPSLNRYLFSLFLSIESSLPANQRTPLD
ncbi:MAG: ATP-binding protein, partial [Anaerolineales bacterium]